MMHIAVDARMMHGQKGGAGNFCYYSLKGLSKIDKQNRYLLFNENVWINRFKVTRPLNILYKIYKESIYKQFILPFILLFKSVDLVYCPNPPIPFFSPCPVVVTIHDVSLAFYSGGLLDRILLYLIYPLTAKRATKIITDSINSKKDIINLLHIPETKIEVIYGAADSIFCPIRSKFYTDSIQTRYGIKKKFILTVPGTFAVRKNFLTVLYAYGRLSESIKSQYDLVVVGLKKGQEYPGTLKAIKDLGLSKNVILTGYVPHEEMPLFYNGADLLVFLSLYEGFGLPPLEAMACGTPVVVSNSSSLPEVVGDAGILVDPLNTRDITNAISKVLTGGNVREELKRRGLERAKLFSWERTAKEILKTFETVVE